MIKVFIKDIKLLDYFWYCSMIFVISVIYYFFRYRSEKREILRVNLLKVINKLLLIFCCLLFVVFFINVNNYVHDDLISSVLVFCSQTSLFVSLGFVLIIKKIRDVQELNLEHPSFLRARKGKIKIGKIVYKGRKLYSYYLNKGDLEHHMCIIGASGTGKSNFLQYLLKNFVKNYNVPFLLSEFKGEYVYLQEIIHNLVVLKPGENYSINIFDPLESNVEIHVERILEIFKEGGMFEEVEYTPQMEKVFYDILLEVCKDSEKRNWENFNEVCSWYLAENRRVIKSLEQTVFAIRNRIRRYSTGSLKQIFAVSQELNIKKFFKMNVLLDLSSIIRLGGRKEDAIFFLNMVLKYLWDSNLKIGAKDYTGMEHVTIVEDAQYFVPDTFTESTKLSSYIEDIAMLLRGTGECLITLATKPSISKEVLQNAGVIVIFRNNVSKKFIRELINLHKNKEDLISMLKEGECLVKVGSMNRPFLIYTPLQERYWLSEEEIYLNNYLSYRGFFDNVEIEE